MREHFTPAEEALLHATLAFANLRRIRSTRQIEGLFMRVPLAGRLFKTVRPRTDLSAYYRDQAELRLYLEKVARLGEAARRAIGQEVAERLGTVGIRVTFDSVSGRLGALLVLDGVQAAYSYAVALLLDHAHGLTRRLGLCGWCGQFNLTLRGKPRMHCSDNHRRRADVRKAAERMRERRRQEKL